MQRTALYATAAAVLTFVLGLPLGIILLLGPSTAGCSANSGQPSVPTTATASEGQIVHYLISQGFTANAAAGVVGNLEQESGLNPSESDGAGGGGLAQWGAGWYQQMSAYATAHGLPPTSSAGQLMYLVFDLHGPYAWLLEKMNAAGDPSTAAFMFETGYERCSGVTTFMAPVSPTAQCMDPKRRLFAVMALSAAGGASTTVPVSFVTGVQCASAAQFVAGSGLDPIPGFRPSRDDMGVDACANTGQPIIAPAPSTLVEVLRDWYAGQPLMLFRFDPPLAGTFDGDQYWYVAEQITPATEQTGTVFQARQVVARFAASGTCIETGWGSPMSNSRTLAVQMGDTGAANPPPGSLTQWAETFKKAFEIPWVGQSP
jgi:hypothetical protein